jgi:two-component system, NarL family, response regulator LiaR
MTNPIRILIADDHAIVRLGLRGLLSTEPDMQVVGEAADGLEATQKAVALRPDVVLLDLVMPHRSGLEAIVEIKRAAPEIRILVLTSFAADAQVFSAIKAGATGYLVKDSSPQELLQAIREVYRGEPSLQPAIARRLMRELQRPPADTPGPETLTAREVDVLQHLGRGLSNPQIAQALAVSERTVRTHIGHILDKLHLASRTQAVLYAQREEA